MTFIQYIDCTHMSITLTINLLVQNLCVGHSERGAKMNDYVILTSFLGTSVEFIEALTVVLAVAAINGWKRALSGASSGLLLLLVLVLVFGTTLATWVDSAYFQAIVGLCMILFGMRWLRKAILRYAGIEAVRNENASFQKAVDRLSAKQDDWFGFLNAFNGVLLEGVEAVFIVITFGLAAKAMPSAIVGSLIGFVIVAIAGAVLHRPLTKLPENTMKFIVGVMLSSFGTFWTGEGLGIHWWRKDASVLIVLGIIAAGSVLISWSLRLRQRMVMQHEVSQ